MSIDNIRDEGNIRVYPNPIRSGSLQVETSGQAFRYYKLMSMDGKVIFSTEASSTKVDIPVGDLSQGLYLLQVRTETQSYVRQVIVQE